MPGETCSINPHCPRRCHGNGVRASQLVMDQLYYSGTASRLRRSRARFGAGIINNRKLSLLWLDRGFRRTAGPYGFIDRHPGLQ